MTKRTKRLAAKFVEHAPPGKHSDGGGLYLYVAKSGSRSWVARRTIDGKQRDTGIGSYPDVSLLEARRLLTGQQAEAASGPTATFGECAEAVHARGSEHWRSAEYADEWIRTLRCYAEPLWPVKVSRIRRVDVLSVLDTIDKPKTVHKVRQRIRRVMNYAMARDESILANPAGEAISEALPRAGKSEHQRALEYTEIPAAFAAIAAGPFTVARGCLRFTILVAARSNEARGARWTEIDDDGWNLPIWQVPAERMKAGEPHKVPLSTGALDVLDMARHLDDGSGLVFPSPITGGPLSSRALLKVLKEAGIKSSCHGFRASIRGWMAAESSASWATAERVLAHTVGDSVQSAYVRRAEAFDQRRSVMQSWSNFVCAG